MLRGTLRIYLGAAPGVGKTYAMLSEGRRRLERGEDVVVGFVETHGRARTAEQIGDLEVIPRKSIQHRGTDLTEMDVDAVLARRPEIVLVDELAHTNAPGAGNEKRWQDIEQLQEAGISVISTVNVQHLESLNDIVEQITGVKQRETVPDNVVRRAEQLQLVDLATETILARLARGDIYPPERIDAALGNYFRAGNLGALRELALLWIADRVEEGIAEYRERHGISQPWETRTRVVVGVTGLADDGRLIRGAARLAAGGRGDFVAVHVVEQHGLAGGSGDPLHELRRLVEELGGTWRDVVGEDVGEALLSAARSLNATEIVLGASGRSRLTELLQGSVVNRVIRGSGIGTDVHVISREAEANEPLASPRTRLRAPTLPRRRVLAGTALAAVGLPGLTALLASLREHIGLPSVLLLFLLLIVAVAAVGGVWPALGAAIGGFLLVNWYFTPPLHTFTIGEGGNVLALAVFVAVAAIVSTFVALAAHRAAEGARSRAEAEALARLAGSSPLPVLLESLQRVFGVDGAAVLHRQGGRWHVEHSVGVDLPNDPAAAEAAVELGDRHVLVLAGGVPPQPGRVLNAFASEIASAIEIAELETEASAAETLAAAGQLRTAILTAVSHDLRTPLAAIKASVTSLLQSDVDWTADERRELLETIDEETDRLNALVGNLLDMSRLQTGALEISSHPVGLEEIVPKALDGIGAPDGRIEVDVPETLPRVAADPGLLERALANIVFNALTYSGPESPVRVTAGAVAGGVDVRVADRGPGVASAERDRIFVPFQRGGDTGGPEGVGLGLAVARGFVEAMGGQIDLEETPGGGLTVVVRLKAAA